MNTKLSAKNHITVLNIWAVLVLTYSFGTIKWTDTDFEGLDRLTRRLLTKFHCLHSNSSIIKLYPPQKERERGLVNVRRLCRIQERNIRNKLGSTEECLMRLAVQADKGYTALKLNNQSDVTVTERGLNIWKTKTLQ